MKEKYTEQEINIDRCRICKSQYMNVRELVTKQMNT